LASQKALEEGIKKTAMPKKRLPVEKTLFCPDGRQALVVFRSPVVSTLIPSVTEDIYVDEGVY